MTEMKLQAPGYIGGMTQEKKIIWAAIAVSVLLHVVLMASTWNISLKPRAEDTPPRDTSRDVELVFEAPLDNAGEENEQPKTYVSVPERHGGRNGRDPMGRYCCPLHNRGDR